MRNLLKNKQIEHFLFLSIQHVEKHMTSQNVTGSALVFVDFDSIHEVAHGFRFCTCLENEHKFVLRTPTWGLQKVSLIHNAMQMHFILHGCSWPTPQPLFCKCQLIELAFKNGKLPHVRLCVFRGG